MTNPKGLKPILDTRTGKTLYVQQPVKKITHSRPPASSSVRPQHHDKPQTLMNNDTAPPGSESSRSDGFSRPSITLMTIWTLVGLELCLDLATTIISFIAYLSSGSECCSKPIEFGKILISLTVPFCVLVLTELVILMLSVRARLKESPTDSTTSKAQENVSMEHSMTGVTRSKVLLTAVRVVVLLNPFFGSLISWFLLYQTESKTEALVVLGLEGVSIVLLWAAFYLGERPFTRQKVLFHCIPLVPFFVTVAMIVLYLQRGGICYKVGKEGFYYDGCNLCDNGQPASYNSYGSYSCPGGTDATMKGDFCGGSVDEQFCWFSY